MVYADLPEHPVFLVTLVPLVFLETGVHLVNQELQDTRERKVLRALLGLWDDLVPLDQTAKGVKWDFLAHQEELERPDLEDTKVLVVCLEPMVLLDVREPKDHLVTLDTPVQRETRDQVERMESMDEPERGDQQDDQVNLAVKAKWENPEMMVLMANQDHPEHRVPLATPAHQEWQEPKDQLGNQVKMEIQDQLDQRDQRVKLDNLVAVVFLVLLAKTVLLVNAENEEHKEHRVHRVQLELKVPLAHLERLARLDLVVKEAQMESLVLGDRLDQLAKSDLLV